MSLRMTPRFKILLTRFCYAVAVVGAIIALFLLASILTKIDEQNQHLVRQSQQIADQGKRTYRDLQTATETLERDMACIGTFFSQKDRENLRITNLRECRIINEQTGDERNLPITFVQPQQTIAVAPETSNDSPKPRPSAKPPVSTPKPEQPTPEPPQQPTQPTPGGILQPATDLLRNVVDSTLDTIQGVLDTGMIFQRDDR
jgi:hypothetical protein